ncbi:cytochrome P450, putative [Talaromyces stipitatus ATCC 10500]|uniref:Cytochrome P450, putative n=1 Tax=Talaromyces stipitatus (strain ATCC 10500 / CBS 375.48 / QM 6759 / NRRL 1006) TaxID=441959 RepID=B8LSW5_TALSN|nr:cytochrome P450, putative [Talaromyces stipitatus ATCC 10500]EED22961.1 cytochrome P450, putative [Talaromyces stipitatus ATCC 10500]
MILYFFCTPFVLFVIFRTYNLIKNYNDARQYGLPIILIPVSFEDTWWMILRPLFSWVEHLPLGLGNWYVYTEMGWPTVDGDRTTKRLGENFVLCSPTSNQIITCYPPGAECIYKNHSKWHFPPAQSQIFAFYGQNVSSTIGLDWQRHRKTTTAAFNEYFTQEVWDESTKQVEERDLEEERDRKLDRIRSTFDVLAMNVLAVVGFGQERLVNAATAGHKQSLMQCLGSILQHILLTAIFNSLKAPDFLLPKVLQQSKNLRPASKERHPTLLEAMVNANEAEKQQLQKTTGRPSYLTESELHGNLFVFNLAGYETTASSMTFALSFLASNPDIQSWIMEEINRYYTPQTSRKEYAATFPKLVRCMALMYETLRLASPAPLLVRGPSSPQELPIITPSGEERIFTVNPGTLVGGHFYGGHLSPRWGPDAHKPVEGGVRFVRRYS